MHVWRLQWTSKQTTQLNSLIGAHWILRFRRHAGECEGGNEWSHTSLTPRCVATYLDVQFYGLSAESIHGFSPGSGEEGRGVSIQRSAYIPPTDLRLSTFLRQAEAHVWLDGFWDVRIYVHSKSWTPPGQRVGVGSYVSVAFPRNRWSSGMA